MLAVFAVPLSPMLDYFLPTWPCQIPALEATGAFSAEIPAFLEFEHRTPLPGRPEELKFENNSRKTAISIVILIWALGAIAFFAVRLWHLLNIKLRFAKSTPLPADHPVSESVKTVAKAMGMKYAPLVWTSEHIKGTQTTGIIHPAILVPASF